jgi:DNA-binding response OmpR family regulator
MSAEAGTARSANPGRERAAGAELRVLLVEDQTLVSMYLAGMLAELGCTVVGPAATVAAALEIAENETLDGAVLDINMRNEYSFPVARTLRRRGIPFFFTIGHSDAILPDDLQGAPCLTKPISMHGFAALVRGLFVEAS